MNKIASNMDVVLTQKQKAIVLGSLLGDGSLRKIGQHNRSSAFREHHCIEQKDYLDWKYTELSPLSSYYRQTTRSVQFETVGHHYLTEQERVWYKRDDNGDYIFKNGKRQKVIPKELELTPFMVAVWFMDDGCNVLTSRYAYLATQSFCWDDAELLAGKLAALDNYKGVRVRKRTSDKPLPNIYIGSQSALRFVKMIEDYVPCECMKYKVDTSKYVIPDERYVSGWVKRRQRNEVI